MALVTSKMCPIGIKADTEVQVYVVRLKSPSAKVIPLCLGGENGPSQFPSRQTQDRCVAKS
jgi:hypothetical protein